MCSATDRTFESGGFDPEAHCVFMPICPSSDGPVRFAEACATGLGVVIASGVGITPEAAGGASASVPGWITIPAGTLGEAGAAGTTVNFHVVVSLPTVRLTV